MINIPKGTKDILPGETEKWQKIEDAAREVCALFNISEIRTPVFEYTELFQRGVGDTTDIVNKEMYTFLDKGNRSITLKPEGTAGVVRSYIENGLFNSAQPLKLYYFSPAFRYERPQAGRLREFHQFGIEIFGAASASIDAELISAASMFLNKIGIKDIRLEINSIGCKTCRAEYNKKLTEYYQSNIDNICETCKERLSRNPMRLLDCKTDKCKEVAKAAPRILDFICGDCKEHFAELKEYLDISGIQYNVNPSIVRGLDYYTRTVFEFVTDAIGAQGTVCGGGRYDGLIEELGGKSTPATGFAMGLERLLLLLENSGVKIAEAFKPDVYVAPIGKEAKKEALLTAAILRRHGYSAETDHIDRSVKAQFKYADKIGARYVVVIGGDELRDNVIVLKNLETGEEKRDKLSKLISELN